MSRTTVLLAAALGCVVLFALWVQSGEEETPVTQETASRGAGSLSDSKSSFPQPKRPRSLLNRQGAAPEAEEPVQPAEDAIEERGEVVVKSRAEPRDGSVEERQAVRRDQRDARLEAKRAQRQQGGRLAGVAPQGQLSRKEPESGEMAKVEQPPLRQPQPVEDEVDEDSLEHLREVALGDPDPDERADAISQLDLDDPAAMDVLVRALEDSDSDVRLAALDELWTNSDEPPLDILARVIHDTDPEVRLEAVRILSESEEPYAQQLLRGALLDRDEDVREEAADALDVD